MVQAQTQRKKTVSSQLRTDSSLSKSANENPPRYSDEELAEFKEIVTRRLQKAEEEYHHYFNLIKPEQHSKEPGGIGTGMAESPMSLSDKETYTHIAYNQQELVKKLKNALERIKNKTYGVCRRTGELIDKARLRAVPHTTLSMEAKNN